jgi:hypothetical protein
VAHDIYLVQQRGSNIFKIGNNHRNVPWDEVAHWIVLLIKQEDTVMATACGAD